MDEEVEINNKLYDVYILLDPIQCWGCFFCHLLSVFACAQCRDGEIGIDFECVQVEITDSENVTAK